MEWNGVPVLVTGAGGFIGSHLVESLIDRGASVTAFLRYTSSGSHGNLEFLSDETQAKYRTVFGNIEDADSVRKAVRDQAIVFHLAALIGIPHSYDAPRSYVQTNVNGTLNVLEAVRSSETARLIVTSTSEVYGTAIQAPIDESHPLQAQSPYSASKIAADKLAESYFRAFDLPVSTVRPFNTYGPRQSARAIIPTVISQALTRDHIEIGSTDPIRDLLFVKDTVEGFIRVAEEEGLVGSVVQLGTGVGTRIGDLVDLILSVMGKDIPVQQTEDRTRPPDSEVFELICDTTRTREVLGWEAPTGLEQGVRETVDFITTHIDRYRPQEYAR